MIQKTAFLSLIGLLDEVFEDLIFKLGHQRLIDFEVDKTVAEVSLEAICHLDEIRGLSQLLLLNF